MNRTVTRSNFLRLSAAFAVASIGAASVGVAPARAQAGDPVQAQAFIQQAGNQLAGIVGSPGSPAQKRQMLAPFVDRVADVNGIAEFCLGRFWRTATPQQQADYLRLFRTVLANGLALRLGDYQSGQVRITTGRADVRDDGIHVPTTVERPNNEPAQVTWVVVNEGGAYKIVDVMAQGVSLRVAQRNDYGSFLTRNGGNVDALITAMRRQVGQ